MGREGGANEKGEPRRQGNKARKGGGHRRGRKDKVLADFNHVEADIKDSLAGFKATLQRSSIYSSEIADRNLPKGKGRGQGGQRRRWGKGWKGGRGKKAGGRRRGRMDAGSCSINTQDLEKEIGIYLQRVRDYQRRVGLNQDSCQTMSKDIMADFEPLQTAVQDAADQISVRVIGGRPPESILGTAGTGFTSLTGVGRPVAADCPATSPCKKPQQGNLSGPLVCCAAVGTQFRGAVCPNFCIQ